MRVGEPACYCKFHCIVLHHREQVDERARPEAKSRLFKANFVGRVGVQLAVEKPDLPKSNAAPRPCPPARLFSSVQLTVSAFRSPTRPPPMS